MDWRLRLRFVGVCGIFRVVTLVVNDLNFKLDSCNFLLNKSVVLVSAELHDLLVFVLLLQVSQLRLSDVFLRVLECLRDLSLNQGEFSLDLIHLGTQLFLLCLEGLILLFLAVLFRKFTKLILVLFLLEYLI